jgi:hypothetical protein
MKVKGIPITIDAIDSLSKLSTKYLEDIPGKHSSMEWQKTIIPATAQILKR